MLQTMKDLYKAVFSSIQYATEGWLLGLSARLAFSSVLLFYFLNSAQTKVGSGFPGSLIVEGNTYAQMFPKLFESVGYDASKISFIPYGVMAYAGTYGEFLIPILILLGLFTRAMALGMMLFIAVMTYVDIYGHDADAATIGAFFDRVQDSAIADQRLLWVFPLVYLVIRGPGWISADAIVGRFFQRDEI